MTDDEEAKAVPAMVVAEMRIQVYQKVHRQQPVQT